MTPEEIATLFAKLDDLTLVLLWCSRALCWLCGYGLYRVVSDAVSGRTKWFG